MSDITNGELTQLRERHEHFREPGFDNTMRAPDAESYCGYCDQDWPCDTARLLDALDRYTDALLNIAGTECVEWPACQPGDRCVSCIARDALARHEAVADS